MERRFSILVGASVLALTLFFLWRAGPKTIAAAQPHGLGSADAAVALAALSDAAVTTTSASEFDAGAPVAAPSGVPGSRLPDGTPVPPLPEKAPRSVRFGVVLVVYAGAQGAPTSARPKAQALELAQKLAADARTDFKAAVVRGDSGSIEDLGRVPRGVREPAPEYVLFTMPAGAVSDPVDTPRGYWIVKRID